MKRMLVLLATLFLLSLTSFSQDFVNKIMNNSKNFSLDYIESTTDDEDKQITNLYLTYKPEQDDLSYRGFTGWWLLKIVDRDTRKSYEVMKGHGISLRSDANTVFYKDGGNIGFQLEFEGLPPSTRNIDVYWGDSKWFSNITINPDKDDAPYGFRFNYILRTIPFYTTVPDCRIDFYIDGLGLSEMKIRRYWIEGNRPSFCGSTGTLTFVYPIGFDEEVRIEAAAWRDNEKVIARWELKEKPGPNCGFIQLRKKE